MYQTKNSRKNIYMHLLSMYIIFVGGWIFPFSFTSDSQGVPHRLDLTF